MLTLLLSFACRQDGDSKPGPEDLESGTTSPGDEDGDGYQVTEGDCDDNNPEINPGASEICDGVDNNCNGETDEGLIESWYQDADQDGYGDANTSLTTCETPAGFVRDNTDCDDSNAAIHPAAEETDCADPIDYNCDGSTGYADADADGVPACEDCNDADAAISPLATEICDANLTDENCNSLADDNDPTVDSATQSEWSVDSDGDGFGDDNQVLIACHGENLPGGDCNDQDNRYYPGAPEDCSDPNDYNCDGSVGRVDLDGDGVIACDDCDDSRADVYPGATEVCDGVDQNCDGSIDEGLEVDWYADSDGDGFGDVSNILSACAQPAGYLADFSDCDDSQSSIYPGATEVCDGVDQNCDGNIDEGLESVWYADADGDGFGDPSNVLTACTQVSGYLSDSSDCDDTRADIFPGALEVCDGVDNDCDGEVDSDAVDSSVWYLDSDADGFGDINTSLIACTQPGGYVADSSDCDDTRADVYPGATEFCDGVDQDCDSSVDEGAVDMGRWYTDNDGDGYGDGAVDACTQPAGTAIVDGDCDDSDAEFNPGASEACNEPRDLNCDGSTGYVDADNDGWAACEDCDDGNAAANPDMLEICDGIDNDCNGLVDETGGASNFYADADSDGFGDINSVVVDCEAPAGFVADATDCNDSDSGINPATWELCDGVDNDCDGTVDIGAVDATDWYQDADSDGYGNAAVSTTDCNQPSGYVADNSDCDDTDARIHPGANERNDGVDEDCDGIVDEGGWAGTGADGALTVTTTTTIGEAWVVTVIVGSSLTVEGPTSLSAGDEVLIINMHGGDTAYAHVGVYEFAWVVSASTNTVVLEATPTAIFGQSSNSSLLGQNVQVVRVPQYTDVTITSTGMLTAPVWDGETGGVLAFRATGTVTVDGVISVDELGYAAGQTGTVYNNDAFQGESYAGTGDGNLNSSYGGFYGNYPYGYYRANYGGGGAMITGGGGNYAGGATAGASWTGGSYPAAAAGGTYGTADLSTLYMGSGGAGVWYGSSNPGPGGDGAGILYIGAAEVIVNNAAGISAIGGTTTHWATGTWTYGAGGGAGGSIWVIADSLDLVSDALYAEGGLGESTHTRVGGDGGYGRIRLDFNMINGYAYGSGNATTEVATVSEPNAGYSTAPQ
jgi:hypothetical protein